MQTARKYRAIEGDMVDAICSRHYPNIDQDQSVTEVLKANPGLAAYGPLLPEGVIIQLPAITETVVQATIHLWD